MAYQVNSNPLTKLRPARLPRVADGAFSAARSTTCPHAPITQATACSSLVRAAFLFRQACTIAHTYIIQFRLIGCWARPCVCSPPFPRLRIHSRNNHPNSSHCRPFPARLVRSGKMLRAQTNIEAAGPSARCLLQYPLPISGSLVVVVACLLESHLCP